MFTIFPWLNRGDNYMNVDILSYMKQHCITMHAREISDIATDKALFSSEKCRYLSYFATITYVVGTH